MPLLLVANQAAPLSPCPATDLIQAALLVCAFMTFVQVTGIRFPKTSPYQWGAGLLSVMGVSFASVPLFTKIISAQMVSGYQHCSRQSIPLVKPPGEGVA